jgi:hypothetical protein
MKRISPLFPLLVLSSCTFAATAFDDNVPAEVIEQVMGAMFGQQVRLYSDVPDGFPPFEMPRDMTILASVDQGYSQRVILKSQFDSQAASALAYGVLLDAGWQLIQMQGMQMPQTGFINQFQPTPQTQLCHDDYGMMQVSAQGGPGVTYVNFNRNITPPGAPMPDCAQINQPRDPPMPNVYRVMQEQMPRLVLPTTGGMSGSGGGGGGGGPNEWETRATLNGPWDLARIYDYFVEQIETQGWASDANVASDNMATGSWTKTVEDAELIGNLTVLRTDENNYDLRFRLIRKGQPNFGFRSGIGGDSTSRVVIQTGPGLGPPLGPESLGIRGAPATTQMVPVNIQGNGVVRD